MNLNCLKFPSVAVLKEFLFYVHPLVIEEVDTILCGVFSEADISVAVKHFHASLLVKQKPEHP